MADYFYSLGMLLERAAPDCYPWSLLSAIQEISTEEN